MLLRWNCCKKKTYFGVSAVVIEHIYIKSSTAELKILNLLRMEKCENDTR